MVCFRGENTETKQRFIFIKIISFRIILPAVILRVSIVKWLHHVFIYFYTKRTKVLRKQAWALPGKLLKPEMAGDDSDNES